MSIPVECQCGAKIRLPDSAAGKRARCRSCGQVFRVPGAAVATPDALATAEAAPTPPAQDLQMAPVGESPYDGTAYGGAMPGARADDGDWIERPARSFWGDAAWSFVFFFDSGNMVTLVALCLVRAFISFLGVVSFGCWALVAEGLLWAWLCAFYFNVITETARGEDGLPDVWVTSIWDDIILPGLRFVGCSLVVLLPAGIAAIIMVQKTGDVQWNVVTVVTAAGLFFWPVIALGTAIGGELPMASIPLLVFTALKTFAPYVLVCVLVWVAVAIPIASQMGVDMLRASARGANISIGGMIALQVFLGGVEIYAWIVAMRLIGLYYRHFKSRFPWVAE